MFTIADDLDIFGAGNNAVEADEDHDKQPRSQALSSHGPRPRRKTLVQAGHVPPKIWEVVKTKTGGGAVESKIR